MNIELRQLRYFVAVAEERHFGRAALRLHMTQPPLSQAIQALEANLGTPLFARTKRSVALTPAGLALLPEAQRLLQQAGALPDLVRRAASGESGLLTLSFVSTADYSILPPLLRAFRETYPSVQIDLQEATSDLQLAQLMAGRIDAGLLIPPLPDKEKLALDYLPVLSEPLVLAAPTGLKALRNKGPIALSSVADMPLIIFPRRISPGFHDTILGCFRAAGLTPISVRKQSRCKPSSAWCRLAWGSRLCHNRCRTCNVRGSTIANCRTPLRWSRPAWPGVAIMFHRYCKLFWNY
ncbi:bacterial regulatory helix-turn-helix, lysR family protein [Collimonas arenae]|nr:bacterial regulatory helix-turn-helix, lysR family protein [Collimonas arenae]